MLGETDLSSSLRRGLTHAFHARGFNEHSRRVHKPQPLNLDSEALNKPEARYWFRDCSHLLEGSDTGNLGEVQRPRIRFFGCLVESAVPYFLLNSFEFSPSVLVMVHRFRFRTLCSVCNLLVVVFFLCCGSGSGGGRHRRRSSIAAVSASWGGGGLGAGAGGTGGSGSDSQCYRRHQCGSSMCGGFVHLFSVPDPSLLLFD